MLLMKYRNIVFMCQWKSALSPKINHGYETSKQAVEYYIHAYAG
jgi:hypothetical protein